MNESFGVPKVPETNKTEPEMPSRRDFLRSAILASAAVTTMSAVAEIAEAGQKEKLGRLTFSGFEAVPAVLKSVQNGLQLGLEMVEAESKISCKNIQLNLEYRMDDKGGLIITMRTPWRGRDFLLQPTFNISPLWIKDISNPTVDTAEFADHVKNTLLKSNHLDIIQSLGK